MDFLVVTSEKSKNFVKFLILTYLCSTKIHRRHHLCHYVSFTSEVDKKPPHQNLYVSLPILDLKHKHLSSNQSKYSKSIKEQFREVLI